MGRSPAPEALRHETPGPQAASDRLSVTDPALYVFKVLHGRRLSRVLGGRIAEGSDSRPTTGLTPVSAPCSECRAKRRKISEAPDGEIVAVAKIDTVKPGQWLGQGQAPPPIEIDYPARNCAIAMSLPTCKDDVKLSARCSG